MNKTINLKSVSHKSLLFGGMMAALLVVSLFGVNSANAAITLQLDFGSRGSDVTELQTYLAANASIYPSGLITGYFGPLTQAAVQRFQAAQGIVSSGSPATTGYGRVGPLTMARINALLGGSGGVQIPWDEVPILSAPSVSKGSTSATITWTTNETTQGRVYYASVPLRTDEATGPKQEPYVSGTAVLDDTSASRSHSVTINNLKPDTQYYYLTRGVDSMGNMSMTWPNTFRTNN